MKLTKLVADRARYPHGAESKQRHFLWDDACRGFGLRVYPSGRRSFVFSYRIKGQGRKRLFTLGGYKPLSVTKAREKAEQMRVLVRQGLDPIAEARKLAEMGMTIGELGDEYIDSLERPAKKSRKRGTAQKRKPSTIRGYRQLHATHIKPIFGDRQPSDLTEAEVDEWHYSRGDTPYVANRALWLLSKLLKIAERRGLREANTNPCGGVERWREEVRSNPLSADDLVKIGEAIELLEGVDGVYIEKLGRMATISTHAAAAIRLLLFTGCRKNEICRLRWEDVDFEAREAVLRDTKNNTDRHVPLTAPALMLLENLPRTHNHPWVIEGRKPGKHLAELSGPWRRVLEVAGLSGIRIHDLRHTVGSRAADTGLSLLIVGKMLGHKQAASTERYAQPSTDPVRDAHERVAAGIAADMSGERADVVKMSEAG